MESLIALIASAPILLFIGAVIVFIVQILLVKAIFEIRDNTEHTDKMISEIAKLHGIDPKN